MVDLSVVRWA